MNNERIGVWLSDLATLTAGSAPIADARVKVAALTAMLATEFPPEAFTRDSLEHVARSCTFFPSYAELTRALAAWWKEHRNNVPLSGAPRIAGKGDPVAAMKAGWWLARRERGEIASIASSLDVLREADAAVYDHLVRTDNQARRIATQRGWAVPAGAEIVPLRPAL